MLSHSRKAYSEVVLRQTTDNFIRCLENAFWHFGDVPQRLILDNLRAVPGLPAVGRFPLVAEGLLIAHPFGTASLPETESLVRTLRLCRQEDGLQNGSLRS